MPVDPANLVIVHYPDPILRQKAAQVPVIDENLKSVAQRMIHLMADAEGVGLAAPQVGLSWRLFVCHVPETTSKQRTDSRSATATPPSATSEPMVYINPTLSNFIGPPVPYEEGCLSLPDIRGDVLRPPIVTITATDLSGQKVVHTAQGLLARCWQHEMDHLDGILILDRMVHASRIKMRRAIKELESSR